MEPTIALPHPPVTRSKLTGSIERVTFFNSETGQCILQVRLDSGVVLFLSTRLPWVNPGLAVTITNLSKFAERGKIHRADAVHVHDPTSEKNLRRFFRSGALTGIGPKLARELAKAHATFFPMTVLQVIEQSPDRLLEIPGIGRARQKQIVRAWAECRGKNQLREFLLLENFPLHWSQLLWAEHGAQSLAYLRQLPYAAVNRHHLDFDLVDRFALKNGALLESTERLRCGLKQTLWRLYKQGHCCFPEEEVLTMSSRQLEVPRDLLEEILELEILEREVIGETVQAMPCLYLAEVWDLERRVASKLLELRQRQAPWGWFNSQKVLAWAQEILGIRLAPLQQAAIDRVLSSSLTVITGGPGTGKTTLIRSLVTILHTQHMRLALCSPTGRAAQRLSAATQQPAQTIHRLLKYDSATARFSYNRENPLAVDLVLVDEASMIDLALMADLLDALPTQAALVLVGDANQIPPVGAGTVLHSLITSNRFEVVRLQEIYRQSEHSSIKENAKRINDGLMPRPLATGDFQYLPVKNAAEAQSVLTHLLNEIALDREHGSNRQDLQILVPLNSGPLGTIELNRQLQQLFRHRGFDENSTAEFGQDFRIGDKVMVVKNDYSKDIYNGDIGFVSALNFEAQFIEVRFPDRTLPFRFSELDRLTLAYAISIHKAQGSEYETVIVIVTKEHLPMAQRHLIYTAVTRGKRQVFLIAEPLALQAALERVEKRWENLTPLLASGAETVVQ